MKRHGEREKMSKWSGRGVKRRGGGDERSEDEREN